jgi:hypothetical protein
MILNLKIEFYNKKVYLNSKIDDILKIFTIKKPLWGAKHLDKEKLKMLMMEFKRISSYYNLSYRKIKGMGNSKYLFIPQKYDLSKAYLTTTGGVFIPKSHYTFEEKGNTAHATSKVPLNLEEGQEVGLPMPSAILRNAPNPGTILTKAPKLEIVPNTSYLQVNDVEIDNIKHEHPDFFKADNVIKDLFNEETLELQKVISTAVGDEKFDNPKAVKDFIINFRSQAYNDLFENIGIAAIEEAIEALPN